MACAGGAMTTIHQRHFGWDNSLPPALEIEDGATVEFDVIEASGGQVTKSGGVEMIETLDFERINPVCGPVRVKGAKPGDVLEVEILDLKPGDWGWTAIIPHFGLLA